MTTEELIQLLAEREKTVKDAIDELLTTKLAERDDAWTEKFTKLEQAHGELLEQVANLKKPAPPGPPGPIDDNGDPNCGYEYMGAFLKDIEQAVTRGRVSDTLQKIEKIQKEKAAGTGFEAMDASRGGYALPEGFRGEIWKRALAISNIMSKVTVIPVTTDTLKMPVLGGYDLSGGTVYGGITFYDEGENDQLAATRPIFEMKTWALGMQGALTHASDHMMRFSPVSLGATIETMFSEALAWRIEHLLLNGTGANQPDGVVGHGCAYDQPVETGQTSADPILFENLSKMYAHQWNKARCEWYFNSELGPYLDALCLTMGTAGTHIPIEVALKRKPYFENDHCAAPNTSGDIVNVDWSQYWVILPSTQGQRPTFDTSIHFLFDYAQTSFRMLFYMDGKPVWRTYETPHYGTNYRTPIVTLATRS